MCKTYVTLTTGQGHQQGVLLCRYIVWRRSGKDPTDQVTLRKHPQAKCKLRTRMRWLRHDERAVLLVVLTGKVSAVLLLCR